MAKKKTNIILDDLNQNFGFAAFIWNDPETKQKAFSSYCHLSDIVINELLKENLVCEVSYYDNESEAKQQQLELSKNFNIDYQHK
jgi:hypothetical protein